jgi:hypothetical protein
MKGIIGFGHSFKLEKNGLVIMHVRAPDEIYTRLKICSRHALPLKEHMIIQREDKNDGHNLLKGREPRWKSKKLTQLVDV